MPACVWHAVGRNSQSPIPSRLWIPCNARRELPVHPLPALKIAQGRHESTTSRRGQRGRASARTCARRGTTRSEDRRSPSEDLALRLRRCHTALQKHGSSGRTYAQKTPEGSLPSTRTESKRCCKNRARERRSFVDLALTIAPPARWPSPAKQRRVS